MTVLIAVLLFVFVTVTMRMETRFVLFLSTPFRWWFIRRGLWCRRADRMTRCVNRHNIGFSRWCLRLFERTWLLDNLQKLTSLRTLLGCVLKWMRARCIRLILMRWPISYIHFSRMITRLSNFFLSVITTVVTTTVTASTSVSATVSSSATMTMTMTLVSLLCVSHSSPFFERILALFRCGCCRLFFLFKEVVE